MADTNRILVGKIVAPQGLQGEVRVQTYTQTPQDLKKLPVFSDKFKSEDFLFVRLSNPASSVAIAKIKGFDDRNAAESLRGTEVFINRSDLPDLQEGEYYQADLIGMKVVFKDKVVGKVITIHNFGAGDILELDNGDMIAFNSVEVDLDSKTIYKRM